MDELERLLEQRLGGNLQKAIEEKIDEFGGLLTRKAAIVLLCKQNGIVVEQQATLSSMPAGFPFSFTAKIERIYPIQTYPGSSGRSVRIHLSDNTGNATLVLWNEQADKAEELCPGDTIKCNGAYLRLGEIALGKDGAIVRLVPAVPLKVSQLTAGICTVEGFVGEIEPEYVYIDRKTSLEKSLSSFMLCDGEACRRVVVWQKPAEYEIMQGDLLRIENAIFKNGEIHVNQHCRIVKQKSAHEKEGVLNSIKEEDKEAIWDIGGLKLRASLEDSLSMLGIAEIPQGIAPSTILSIKASEVVGKKARFRLENGKIKSFRVLK
ncbi:MAG: hypothetical protein QW275_00100 [Candidatus Anstonellaceae archaeon]